MLKLLYAFLNASMWYTATFPQKLRKLFHQIQTRAEADVIESARVVIDDQLLIDTSISFPLLENFSEQLQASIPHDHAMVITE